MNFDFLKPVDEALLAYAKMQQNQSLGQSIEIYTSQSNLPEVLNKKIAIVGVEEGRAAVNNYGTGDSFNEVRKELYKLFPGNWPLSVVDLGNIEQGSTIEDSYFALKELLS